MLDKQYIDELNRAHGLYTHGVGVGAYVYLRRIIERLIAQVEKEEKIESTGQRIRERISGLRGKLPDFLVDEPRIYGILSKGIHELSEEECRAYFPILASAVEAILDQLLDTKRRAKRAAALSKRLAGIDI